MVSTLALSCTLDSTGDLEKLQVLVGLVQGVNLVLAFFFLFNFLVDSDVQLR